MPLPLLASRRFLPLFMVQFLGALNDNLFRNAIFVMITFQLAAQTGDKAATLVSLGAALFILPFFLFSATAGAVSDRFEKTRLIRLLKAIEVVLVLFAAGSLALQNVTALLGALFLLGVQAAFFGPVKYSVLPNLVARDELAAANGYVEGGTFIAILIGTIAGGITVTLPHGPMIVAAAMGLLALAGWAASFAMPPAGSGDPSLAVRWRVLAGTMPLLREARINRPVWRAIIGISWFWFVGAIFLSILPAYVKDILNGEPKLVTVLLTVFSVGIAVGSILCGRWQAGRDGMMLVKLGAWGMAAAIFVFYALTCAWPPQAAPITIADFLASGLGQGIVAALFVLALSGGLFTVPLYTAMQSGSPEDRRARVIAANNIVNSLFMVVSSLFTMALFQLGFDLRALFLILAGAALAVACGTGWRPMVKLLFRCILRLLYGARFIGGEHLTTVAGRGAVIIVNHVSLIDGILLAAFLPGFPAFAINTQIAEKWWAKLFLTLVDHHMIDPTKPLALKKLAEMVEDGRHIVIFPEGRITTTGGLMKIYEGPGIIAVNAGAPVVPVRIDGPQYTPMSYMRGKLNMRWFPRVTITVTPPVEIEIPPDVTGRARRQLIADRLYDIMAAMMFRTSPTGGTLTDALFDARARNGGGSVAVNDMSFVPLTYNRLALGADLLGRRLADRTKGEAHVGVLLPNGGALPTVLFGLLGQGRVAALLNFTAGLSNLRSALRIGAIRTVITSRRFIEMAELGEIAAGLSETANLIYLEDVAATIGRFDRLGAWLGQPLARARYQSRKIAADDTAVILFTSGSEGAPKGVALSHRNILANMYQLAAKIDFNRSDLVFGALPAFHAFGLTAGLLLPILCGVRVFTYPSPLHYRTIAELVYDTGATILFGTDTFLAGYGRAADPYDFYSLRYVFAGAEKLSGDTRRLWQDKFGHRILEGYGVTEGAPALAFNTPMQNLAGTVGRFLPDIDYRLESVAGIDRGGRLFVRGPNIMRGYLKDDRPGVLQPLADGWYDTGDIVELDARGFVTIVGRAKRFVKIGGEMISLGAVENYIQPLLPDAPLAAVAVPDARKGEQIVLFVTADIERGVILKEAQARGLGELMVPRKIMRIDGLPVLGSGKTDYVSLNKLAAEAASNGPTVQDE